MWRVRAIGLEGEVGSVQLAREATGCVSFELPSRDDPAKLQLGERQVCPVVR